jgi:hypothetical protein
VNQCSQGYKFACRTNERKVFVIGGVRFSLIVGIAVDIQGVVAVIIHIANTVLFENNLIH